MAQKLGFRGIEELIIHYRAEGLSYREIHEKTGISKRTLEENAPYFLRGLRRQTRSQKEACRNNLKKAVAARMKKYFDHPTANGKSKKQMSLEAMARTKLKLFGGDMEADELGRELESKQPKGAGAYYTPEHIADPTSGSGSFLKKAADELQKGLTKNPPYKGKK